MKKVTLAAILLIGCAYHGIAQTEEVVPAKKEKKIDHTVGVQVNDLIRQVFNFSNTPAINNPYQVIYHANMRKTGWGLRAGAGYQYESNFTNTGVNEVTTKINDIHLRLGVEKAYKLGNRWSTGVGLDGLYNNDDDKTTSITKAFDTTTTITHTKMSGFGGGAMGWLRFHISEKILIGTEASFYYTSGKQKNVVSITRKDNFTNAVTTTETTSKPTISEGKFSLPVAIYILVKF